jgi:hypothetical protein
MKLPPVKAEKYNMEVKKMNPSYVYESVDHPPIDGCWLYALLGPVPPFLFFGWEEIKDLPRSHHKHKVWKSKSGVCGGVCCYGHKIKQDEGELGEIVENRYFEIDDCNPNNFSNFNVYSSDGKNFEGECSKCGKFHSKGIRIC